MHIGSAVLGCADACAICICALCDVNTLRGVQKCNVWGYARVGVCPNPVLPQFPYLRSTAPHGYGELGA